MATKNFKGFQLVALATFNGSGFTKDKDTLYFVRTSGEKGNGTDGFLYFNGKKYGTGADVITKYGELNGKTISAYVADEIAKVTTTAGELEKKVTANTTAIEKINGEANVDGSIKKAVADVIGTEGDAATADTIKGAKKAAADAKAAANAKVASVSGENAIKVDSTTATAPKVSLVLDPTQGNVKLSQSAKGLKAEVEIPAATVTGVKAGDKVLALEGTELTSTISLSIDATAGEDGKKYIRLKGIDGADLGKIDTADFVKDGMLTSAELVTNPVGQDDGTYIKLTWNTDGGKQPMYINVTSLIDVYTAGNGLSLSDHEFSVNFDVAATKDSVDKVAGRVSTLEGKVGSAAVEGGAAATGLYKDIADNKAAIVAEETRAKKAEQANAEAIATLNGNDTVTGSVDKKIKDALEAGAVTLEVKDDDAYLGVTSVTTEGKGTVYTLASNEAAINKAIKDAADAVQVSVTNGTYVKGSVDEAGRVITLSETVQEVATSSASKKGLAEASDVKDYVDKKVSNKNVTAEGESGDTALVGASAVDNKVTVTTTKKLKDAVAKAETSVQSVNGKASSAVTLTGADIATDQNVGESANATVNVVLADIYSKIGKVQVSSNEKTITVDETGRIIDVHRQTVEAAQEAGHVALECGADGALYGVMYYSGDDAE